ncbi:Ig-like domain-containing protein [Roseburia faecis]|nr:Ig-like domain-containing protein [Roseburia faecis]
MKSSKKVLAFALAAAMVVTAVPATNAQAASTAKLSAKKATVYSAGYKTVTVTTPKSWKSVKVTATSNKKSVATVKKTAAKKIKVTGVKPGTAKVTVKVTYKTSTKKSAKTKTKKLTYTMKVAKVGVALSGESVVAIGSTTKLTNTKKNSSRAKITYTSSDDTIAKVDATTGVVTGVKAGKATITAKITVGKDSAETTKDVEVKNHVLSTVAQNKLTELKATVAGDTKNLKPTDFTVKNETTNVVYPVSKVTVDSKDASQVTLTLFSEAKDAATYDVTLDGITKTFVASDGKVASVAPNTLTVPYATETEIKLVSKDANGVIIDEVAYGKQDASKYDFTLTTNNGYVNGTKLYLNKINDTATVEITYKSGKYDQNGKAEGNVTSGKLTITAVDQSAINNFDVRIDDSNKSYDKAKDEKKIAAKDTKVAYFMIKNADGKEISDYSKYSVVSSDPTTLMVGTNSNINAKSVLVTGVKEGTAYLLIKKDDKVVGSVAVTVVAEKAVATLELDKYSVTLSNVIRRPVDVNVTLKDQYGNDMTDAEAARIYVECLAKPGKAAGNHFTGNNTKKITFTAGDVAGNYTFKISYKNKDGKEIVAKTVSVAVKSTNAAKASSWNLNITNDNLDIKVDKDNKTSKTVKAEIIGSADGADLYSLTDVSYVVKKADGTVIYSDGVAGVAAKANGAFVNSNGALSIEAVTATTNGDGDPLLIKNLEAGTYTVYAEGKDNVDSNVVPKITTTFTIKDTQAKATVDPKHNSVDARTTSGSAISAVLADSVVVKYGDYTYTNVKDYTDAHTGLDVATYEVMKNNGKIVKFTSGQTEKLIASGEGFTVTKVTVWVNAGTNTTPVWLAVEAPISGYFSVK